MARDRGAASAASDFVRELRAAGYDLVIDAHSNARSSFLAWCSGARAPDRLRARLCEGGRGLALPPIASCRSGRASSRCSAPDLLRPLGDRSARRACGARDPRCHARVGARAGGAARRARPVVAIHPGVSDCGRDQAVGSGALRPHCDSARARARRAVLVTWGPRERELAERVVAAVGGLRGARAARPRSILELAALYEACDLVIGADTGSAPSRRGARHPGRRAVRPEGSRDLRALGRAHAARPRRSCGGRSTAARATGARCSNVICMPAIQVGDVIAGGWRTGNLLRSPTESRSELHGIRAR